MAELPPPPDQEPMDFGSSQGAEQLMLQRHRLLNDGLRADNILRVIVALALIALFIAINLLVWHLIGKAFASDAALLRDKLLPPEHRLVTDKVLIALITATALEVAAGIAAVVSYLFPPNPRRLRQLVDVVVNERG